MAKDSTPLEEFRRVTATTMRANAIVYAPCWSKLPNAW